MDYARRYGGKVYQPITHPDLSDVPAIHKGERFELMRSNLHYHSGTLLDIGANLGYFCHRFEDEGFHCYAVESTSSLFAILDRLRVAERREFTAIHASVFDFWEKSDFDVVLALNIFHHFLKTAETYELLIQFLKRLQTRVMFFEPHLDGEAQMQGAYRNLGETEFVRFIAQNTGLTRWEQIGRAKDGRAIYKLTPN